MVGNLQRFCSFIEGVRINKTDRPTKVGLKMDKRKSSIHNALNAFWNESLKSH